MTAFLCPNFAACILESNWTKVPPLAIDKHHVALGKMGETKMNFRSLTRIFSRTRSAALRYEDVQH